MGADMEKAMKEIQELKVKLREYEQQCILSQSQVH